MTPEAEIAEQQPKRVSIVIVSFNRAETLRESLSALGDAHQVLVVDNNSSDGTVTLEEDFPHVRFIRLPKNCGLTRAMNIGVRAAEGACVLFLHDDTVIDGEAVARLADTLDERQDVAAVAPLLLREGTPAPQVGALPSPSDPNPALRPAEGGDEIQAERVSGAAIMFRSFFLRALRQIDERYGNYGGIIELCAQVRRANRRLIILRNVTAVHRQLRSPMNAATIEGDQASGTAVFLGRHHGFVTGMLYRLKTALGALFKFRIKVLSGVVSGAKIDGTH
ncbi:MAG TPA: glycosyltransferase [Bryobacteraceae bacterium]|nr:glycosyltransferase [Bryobacteraceae bacterium]